MYIVLERQNPPLLGVGFVVFYGKFPTLRRGLRFRYFERIALYEAGGDHYMRSGMTTAYSGFTQEEKGRTEYKMVGWHH